MFHRPKVLGVIPGVQIPIFTCLKELRLRATDHWPCRLKPPLIIWRFFEAGPFKGKQIMNAIFDWLVILLVVILVLFLSRLVTLQTVFENERGVVYRNGRFHRVLQPGRHWTFAFLEKVQSVDVRARVITIPGQDVLTSDNITVKVSIAVNFKVDDPFKALNSSFNYFESLYSIVQLELRDLFGITPIDELLAKRGEIGKALFEKSRDKVGELGLILMSADIKDIMLPGDLKNIFAQIVNARNEGLAALERARGESASLRNLANTARLLENNPALLQLRILQALDGKSGNTIVLSISPDMLALMPRETGK
jgi:regulator of protease activity HflC (stomatin/prohibitin superfamily)